SSGMEPATTGWMLLGTAHVTSPAPTRSAALDAMVGAPDFPTEPPMISACPYSPLLEFSFRRGRRIGGASFHINPIFDVMASLGEPMLATTIGPRVRALKIPPGFRAVKVTMALLRHELGWSTLNESESAPEGISTEITGALDSPIRSTARLASSGSGGRKPVPKMASISKSESLKRLPLAH